MIEKLLKVPIGNRSTLATAVYDPTQAVVGREEIAGKGNELTVLFPPWHGGKRACDMLTWRLLRRGDSVLRYAFHDDILHPDPAVVTKSFRNIAEEVADDLHTIADQDKFERIKLTALSLGTLGLAMTATEFSRFDSATLVTPGSRLAPCIWDGKMTQRLREAYQINGFNDSDELDGVWHTIAPVRHTDALQGKKLTVVVSQNDVAIPTEYQYEYLGKLERSDIRPVVEFSEYGHYGTIANFCMRGNLD